MNLALRSLTVCMALLLASCVPPHARLQEIQLPPEPIMETGYSLLPPNEQGWVVAGRDRYRLALAKKGEGPDETYAIQATLVKLPTFTNSDGLMRFVNEGEEKNTDPQRYKIMAHDTTVQQQEGIACARSHFVVEDTGAVKQTARIGSMILEALSLTCPHPRDATVGVFVSYSHRYYQEEKDSAFEEKAMHVFRDVEYVNP